MSQEERKLDKINTNIDNDEEEEASPPIFGQGLKNFWVLASTYISWQNNINTKDINIKITNNNDNNIDNVDVEERRPILG